MWSKLGGVFADGRRQCEKKQQNCIYMVLCYVLVLSMLDVAFQIECSDFTSFFISVNLENWVFGSRSRFISHVGRIHIAHRISTTMNEWMACNLQRIENCCFVSFSPSFFRSEAACTLLGENDLKRWVILISSISKILYTSASPEENWNTQTDIFLCFRFLVFLVIYLCADFVKNIFVSRFYCYSVFCWRSSALTRNFEFTLRTPFIEMRLWSSVRFECLRMGKVKIHLSRKTSQ